MRITELPQAASVAQTDDLAIDVPGGRTYRVPRSVLAPAPFQTTIPTGQWSGSGSDRYITVTASNVTADAMLYPFYDNASAALLNGPVWVIPADGSFTIHTSAIPSGTVTISVLLAGIVGEAQYQVLADVYSRAQVDTIVSQSTAKAHDIGTEESHGAAYVAGDTFSLPGFSSLGINDLIVILARRWGYVSSVCIRKGVITAGIASNVILRNATGDAATDIIKLNISSSGVVTIVSASNGFFPEAYYIKGQ